ncbi:hypothetical protein GOP47_0001252 [Adiantum capillus-veneris]|uniref:FLZ-type domain-containing protein n=1 Tax=Adiantum capillus-veneris TaxID=13818 RepID=A0A9D4VGJ3_ADICA|nr:hypothetical protein GOP47_0000687 [Adiantum capillus-veneris]KAI5085083.1 hypothetical protein GOP47_0001252 [Adiantum capillus-veneris]
MLGKRSRPLLRTASKLSFPHVEDFDQKPVDVPVRSKHSFVPQHVLVGFDIQQESKPSDVCESPRSVLDVNVLPLEKQPQGKSFRSYVPALPLQNKGSQGVGLAIIVHIHAEEKGDQGPLSLVGHGSAFLTHYHELNPSSLYPQGHCHHQPSQPIAIATSSCSREEPTSHNSSEFLESSGLQDDALSSMESDLDMEFFGSDYASPKQEYVVYDRTSFNTADNDEDYIESPSIFSLASVPSNYGSLDTLPVSFLEACGFCTRAFVPGKDIFIYRGDQAFCSAECRGEKIKIDEYKEKLMTLYS